MRSLRHKLFLIYILNRKLFDHEAWPINDYIHGQFLLEKFLDNYEKFVVFNSFEDVHWD